MRSLARSVSHGALGTKRNVRNIESKATIKPLSAPEFGYISQGVFRIHQIVVRYRAQPSHNIEQAGVIQLLEIADIEPAQFPFSFTVPIPFSTTVHTNRISENVGCQFLC